MSVSLEWRQINERVAVVTISGRSSILDGSIVQQTARRMLEDGTRYFVFNLTSLSHMDSYGLGQLIATYLSVRDHGGDVKLVNPTPPVKEILRNTRLNTVLEVFDSDDEAINSIQQPQG